MQINGGSPVVLRGPVAGDSVAARLMRDGALSLEDFNEIAGLVGSDIVLATEDSGGQTVQRALSYADLKTAGIVDPQDQEALLKAYGDHLKTTRVVANGGFASLEEAGFDPVNVKVRLAGPPAERKPGADGLVLREVVIRAPRPLSPEAEFPEAEAGTGMDVPVGELDRFTPKQKEAFGRLLTGLDPVQQRQVMDLLARGVLSDRAADGLSLVEHLAELATLNPALPDPDHEAALAEDPRAIVHPYRGGVEQARREGLAVVLNHLVRPTEVFQGQFGTCAATSRQFMLAREKPAEYVRLAVALLGPAGSAELADGTGLRRHPDYLVQMDRRSPSGGSRQFTETRPLASRVIQSAFMDVFSPDQGIYSNRDDRHWRSDDGSGRSGLTGGEQERLTSAVNGETFSHRFADEGGDLDLVLRLLDAGGAAGVPLDLRWSRAGDQHGMHALIATGTSEGHLLLFNPWGNQYEQYPGLKRHWDAERQMPYVLIEKAQHHPAPMRIYADGLQALPYAVVTASLYAVYERVEPGAR